MNIIRKYVARKYRYYLSGLLLIAVTFHFVYQTKDIEKEVQMNKYVTFQKVPKPIHPSSYYKAQNDKGLFDESIPGRSDTSYPDDKMIDFAIVGFPKCSTTFLRNSLLSSTKQIFFGNDENEIHYLDHNDVPTFKKLFKNHTETINGFKCPDLLYSEVGVFNLHTHFPTTDLIISVRHPVLWFQSFYNYRVRNGYKMAEPHQLIGNCPGFNDDILNSKKARVEVQAHKVCTDR